MKIVTHSGKFHADDVFAVAVFSLLYPELNIIRSREESIIKTADIVVDVGGVYDVTQKRFDHHQEGGAGTRDNSIPYASFGLVWKEMGEKLCGSREVANCIEERLVWPIDALDNGISLSKPLFENISDYGITDYFDAFVNHTYKNEEYLHEVFMEVVLVAKDLLLKEIRNAEIFLIDLEKMKILIDQTEDKRLIVLEEYLPWKKILIPIKDSLYVVYPRTDDKWGVEAVPILLHGFERKKLFPEPWAGKRDEEMAKISGVSDATFCHNSRFIAVAQSKEGAVKLAQIALNA